MSNFKQFKLLIIFCLFASFEVMSIEVLEVKILNSYSITKQFPGKLLPIEQSKLAFEIPGKIKRIYVDVGDYVKKGDVLAKLDDRESNAQLNQAKAKYDLSKQEEGVTQTPLMLGSVVEYQVRILIPD